MNRKAKRVNSAFTHVLGALLIALVTTVATAPTRGAELLVSSIYSNEILRYDETGVFIDAFVPAGAGGLSIPYGLVFGPDGNLYVNSSTTNEVLRYDGTTGAFIDAFVTASSGGLGYPVGLVFGPDGHLYVASAFTNQILRYNGATGAFIDVFVPAGAGGLNGPSGLVFGPDGHLYVSSNGTGQVLRYDGTTGAFIDAFVTQGSGGLYEPSGLIFKPTGLFLSPASGKYFTTQNFDLGLMLEMTGDAVSVVGESATFDGADITARLAYCIHGELVAGGIAVRCPGLGGQLLSSVGIHTLMVTLDLSDGTSATGTARWEGVVNTEPPRPSRSLFR
jgi:DNA-binding beta-propeller fold protein YncE